MLHSNKRYFSYCETTFPQCNIYAEKCGHTQDRTFRAEMRCLASTLFRHSRSLPVSRGCSLFALPPRLLCQGAQCPDTSAPFAILY